MSGRALPSIRAAIATGLAAAVIAAACGREGTAPTATPAPTARPASIATPPPGHIVAISAGHGGPGNSGAVHTNAAGEADLIEKDLTLDVARRLDALLRADGYRTVLIRDCDCALSTPVPGDLAESVRRESQARTDVANAAGAEALVLIHFNGSDDPAQAGTSVYYDANRPFGERSGQLATYIYEAVLARLHDLGYDARPGGVLSDGLTAAAALTGTGHTYTLGEAPGFRASLMPGMIGEALFITNDAEAALLLREDVRQAIAQAYKDGLDHYFAGLTP